MAELLDLEKALRKAYEVVTDAEGMGSFVLGVCFIEWMAGYYFAKQTTGEDYRDFVGRFLPQYIKGELYDHLRCGLVHGFTDRGKGYDFREDRPEKHLKFDLLEDGSGRRRIINLSNFQNDLLQAMEELFSVFKKNPEMAKRALNRFETAGMILGEIQTQ